MASWYRGIGKWWLWAYLLVLSLPVLPMFLVKLYRYITQLYPYVSNYKIDPLYWATDYSAITLYAIFCLPITLGVWLQLATIIVEQFRGMLEEFPIPHVRKLKRAAFDLVVSLGLLAILVGQAGYIMKPLRIWLLGMPRLESMLSQPGMPHVYSPGLPIYLMMGLLWFCLAFLQYQGRTVTIQRVGFVMLVLTTLITCSGMFATNSFVSILNPISAISEIGWNLSGLFSPLLYIKHFEYFWLLGLITGVALILSIVFRRHGSLVVLTAILLSSSLLGALAPTRISSSTLSSIRKFVEQPDKAQHQASAEPEYFSGPDHLPITPTKVVYRTEACLHSIWYGITSPLFDLVFSNQESPIDGGNKMLIMSPVPVRWGVYLPMSCFWVYWLGNILYVFVVFLIMRLVANASRPNLSTVRHE